MTLPDRCDWCGWPMRAWDDAEETPCVNCGSVVRPWEDLTLEQRRQREFLIRRRLEIDTASVVTVSKDVL